MPIDVATILTAAESALAAPPRPPRDIALFSSNVLFGEPGIYPDGPLMVPATGEEPDVDAARELLTRCFGAAPVGRALAYFDDDALGRLVPTPAIRAALASLVGTVGEPALDAVLVDGSSFGRLAFGRPASPGRVVGPPSAAAPGRVVNERYRGEHPALMAPSILHDLLWSGPGAGQYEEVVLHALVAMVHVQLVARCPALGHLGTELARRQNSLAITLLNSRRPGSAAISLIAPDGPGTIPGGSPSMQTPDFWSIPFVAGERHAGGPVPAPLARIVALVTDGTAPAGTLRVDEALGAELSAHLGRRWLPVRDQLAAAVALGLVAVDEVAALAGSAMAEVVDALGLAPAVACWSR